MIGEMMVCPNCGRVASHDSYFSAMVCRQCGWIKYDSPTNADRIRGMDDEELAQFLVRSVAKKCPPGDWNYDCGWDNSQFWAFWLRQPVGEEHDGQTI